MLFDFDSDRIRPDAERTLTEVAEVLKAYGQRPMRIEGHTDSVASDDYNLKLSERRAQSVQRVARVARRRQGRASPRRAGASRSRRPPTTPPAGRQQNRRVEVIIEAVARELEAAVGARVRAPLAPRGALCLRERRGPHPGQRKYCATSASLGGADASRLHASAVLVLVPVLVLVLVHVRFPFSVSLCLTLRLLESHHAERGADLGRGDPGTTDPADARGEHERHASRPGLLVPADRVEDRPRVGRRPRAEASTPARISARAASASSPRRPRSRPRRSAPSPRPRRG